MKTSTMGFSPVFTWLLCFLVSHLSSLVVSDATGSSCKPDKLTVYKVIFHTYWSRDRFPKHYPDWRPPAQWSRLIGRSHDASYVLFRQGLSASRGLKTFAEEGRTDDLENQNQGDSGVYDEFTASAISTGVGFSETTFFIDGNHSRVSLISRIIPSPDWFVGLDSFDLCVDGNWLDSITIEADPLDAGTDNGFTFTAPDWPTEPQGTVYKITSSYPSHPAGSFYYPYMKRLPAISTFTFIKVKEYELSEVFRKTSDGIRDEPVKAAQTEKKNSDLEAEIEEERVEEEHRLLASTLALNSIRTSTSSYDDDKSAIYNSIVSMYSRQEAHPKRKTLRKYRTPRDCKVSDWGMWGPCSKSCGIGEMSRRREILKHARRGGKLCPPLVETKWCGSSHSCNNATYYFNYMHL